ncbi:MAG: hypothetical protein U7126_04110 [Microcoleus sp.]
MRIKALSVSRQNQVNIKKYQLLCLSKITGVTEHKVNPSVYTDSNNTEAGNRELGIGNWELGIGHRESGIGNWFFVAVRSPTS